MALPSSRGRRFIANHLVWVTLALGFLLNMLGQAVWWPDLLLIVLLYWVMHYPSVIGLGTSFVLGLIMDVQSGSLLGQHAFSYVLSCYIAVAVHRRLLWFPIWSQSIRIFPIFLITFSCTLGLRLILGGSFFGLIVFWIPCLQAALWPIVSQILERSRRWASQMQHTEGLRYL